MTKPKPPEDPVYLYILLRVDLPDRYETAGKLIAQGSHAANQCVSEVRDNDDFYLTTLLEEWEAETGHGFGTCIVLSVSDSEMREAVAQATLRDLHSGITNDPSYPIRDGIKMQYLSVDTCAFVFGRKSLCSEVLGRFPLMK